MANVDVFSGQYKFLSNFAGSPFTWRGREWKTVEHAFQAAKCLTDAESEMIRGCLTPREAKRMGRTVQLRPDWEEIKESVMLDLVRLKFRQNRKLAEKLLLTGTAKLVEGNRWHDNTWGKCTCRRCAGEKGKNLLGKVLMAVRAERRIWKV